MSETICEKCGTRLSPTRPAQRQLEEELKQAFGWAETRPAKRYGINGVSMSFNVLANVTDGIATPSQVVECLKSQLPRDARLYPVDALPMGLIRQAHGRYGVAADSLYILIASHEWEPTPAGGSFGRIDINWGDLDK